MSKNALDFLNNINSISTLKDIKSGYLMLEDTVVLYFNFDDGIIETFCGELVPYLLKQSYDNYTGDFKSSFRYLSSLQNWFANRIIAMSIGNYKQLTSYFGIAQSSNIEYKAKVALNCRAISLEDAYWVKYEDECILWESINPNHNHLSDIVVLSLSDTIPSITGNLNHPNLTMSGTFAKTWVREGDKLFLIKAGKTEDAINVKVEIMASEFFDTLIKGTIDYVSYVCKSILVDNKEKICSICESYYKEGYSVVKAFDIIEYLGLQKFMVLLYDNENLLKAIANMIVLDYIIANTDRHTDNYGFYTYNINGNIISCVPLYDFNYAFISDIIGTDFSDTLCQVFNDGRNIKDVVVEFAEYIDLKFDSIKLDDFFSKYSNIREGVLSRIQFIETLIKRGLID